MQGFKTVEEKAGEWNVTPRHIQYLCRTGKVQGAVKRAGSWFIPDGVPSPIQNTKANAGEFKYAGTKSKVFNKAIELFMLKGFNDVSLRDIAKGVGIQQSTIYNHFSSKQEILDTIYDFYCHYFRKERLSFNDLEPILQNGSLMEIIQSVRYGFPEECMHQMADITNIIFQRIAIDQRARDICKTYILDDGVRYVEDVMNRAIELGRFSPIDTHAMAVFINSVSIYTLYCWIIDPSMENITKFTTDEQTLYKYAADILKG